MLDEDEFFLILDFALPDELFDLEELLEFFLYCFEDDELFPVDFVLPFL